MTVSHIFFNREEIEADLVHDEQTRELVPRCKDKCKDTYFDWFTRMIAISTNATFKYDPTKEEIYDFYADENGVKKSKVEDIELEPHEFERISKALQERQQKLPVDKRKVQGDASETGLVKFAQKLFELEDERDKYPIFRYFDNETNQPIECQIPFNSEHKFNLFIRDMDQNNKNPGHRDQGLMVVLKGAPERVLKRCTSVYVDGEERPLTKEELDDIEQANFNFGSQGERVLAVAIRKLDPQVFPKEPAYKFDMSKWKEW